MTPLSAEKPHDMIIGRAKRGQISRTDSEFFNGIGQQLPVIGVAQLSRQRPLEGWTSRSISARNVVGAREIRFS